MNHLLAHWRLAMGGWRRLGLPLREFFQQIVGEALRLVTPADHDLAGGIDGGRIFRIQEKHGCKRAGIKGLFIHLAQQVAHVHRHIAKINIDRARCQALVADRAVIGDVFKFFPMTYGYAAPCLFFIQEGFDQQRRRENLVARRVKQVRARHVRRTDGFAFAATQAVFDAVGNRTDITLLHDQRLMPHQPEGRRVSIAQVGMQLGGVQQLAFVEATFRIDTLLVIAEFTDFGLGEEFELGNTNAMLAGDHPIERPGQRHDFNHRGMRGLQHVVVVGIHRDVGVHIAVARMHVQGDEYPPAQDALMDGAAFFQHRLEGCAAEDLTQLRAHFGFPRNTDTAILQHIKYPQTSPHTCCINLGQTPRQSEFGQFFARAVDRRIQMRE